MRQRNSTRIKPIIYYVYIQNIPEKYAKSEIFPEIVLPVGIKEDISDQQIHRSQCCCLFGFKNKSSAVKFQRMMVEIMPSFVQVNHGKKVQVSCEKKQQKEYYDSLNFNKTIQNASMEIEKTDKSKMDQKSMSFLHNFSLNMLKPNFFFTGGKNTFDSFWKES